MSKPRQKKRKEKLLVINLSFLRLFSSFREEEENTWKKHNKKERIILCCFRGIDFFLWSFKVHDSSSGGCECVSGFWGIVFYHTRSHKKKYLFNCFLIFSNFTHDHNIIKRSFFSIQRKEFERPLGEYFSRKTVGMPSCFPSSDYGILFIKI